MKDGWPLRRDNPRSNDEVAILGESGPAHLHEEPEREATDRNHWVSGAEGRQDASRCDTIPPDSGAAHQNPDPILDALRDAVEGWSRSRDPDALSRKLRDILEALEAR